MENKLKGKKRKVSQSEMRSYAPAKTVTSWSNPAFEKNRNNGVTRSRKEMYPDIRLETLKPKEVRKLWGAPIFRGCEAPGFSATGSQKGPLRT